MSRAWANIGFRVRGLTLRTSEDLLIACWDHHVPGQALQEAGFFDPSTYLLGLSCAGGTSTLHGSCLRGSAGLLA